jgi:glycogen debranching enzyme
LVCFSANKTRKSFLQKFWFEEGNYLYDVIDENGIPDASLRPNQLFAISLPFVLIEDDRTKSILKIVEEKLYTSVGLRSLPQDDARYVSVYGGDALKRDSCYHQGTVWSWLLGGYVDALVKLGTDKSLIKNVIENFVYHLNEGCIGSVSEIFDGDFPHTPKGCVAQAWGVAEILRVIKEYDLITEEEIITGTKTKKLVKDSFA